MGIPSRDPCAHDWKSNRRRGKQSQFRAYLPGRGPAARGSALVAVLWCLVLLSVVVASTLHTTRLALRVAKNYADTQQAYYLALAGVETAKARIYEEARILRASGESHSTRIFDDPQSYRDVPLGRGLFRVVRGSRIDESQGGLIYGVSDEESRLNVNVAALEELRKLPAMTDPIAAAVVDWRDDDSAPSPQGAERDYYAGLSPPYLPGDKPFGSLREMLMVRGVSPDLLFGEDHNGNGLLDSEEDDGTRSMPPDNAGGILDRGWSELLAADSAVRNVNLRGEARVNIKTATEEELAAVDGISQDIAKAIVLYRKERNFESLADLLEVTPLRRQDTPAPAGGAAGPQPQGASAPAAPALSGPTPLAAGQARPASQRSTPAPEPALSAATPAASQERVISEELFKRIADSLTTESAYDLEGVVNINTAGRTVLACLPGITEVLADAIVSQRRQNGPFASIAGLLDVPGMTRDLFKQIASRVAVRSETFRIAAEGLVSSTGARKRLDVVVRVSRYAVDTLYYREEP